MDSDAIGVRIYDSAGGINDAADLQANYRVIIERKGSIDSQKKLGSVIIQVRGNPACISWIHGNLDWPHIMIVSFVWCS